MWQRLADLAGILGPREAEAKVVYNDPVLRDLDTSLQQGTAQPVDEAGRPYPPMTVQMLRDVVKQAHAVPETARVTTRVPDADPTVLGRTYMPPAGAAPGGPIDIAIRPYTGPDRQAGLGQLARTLPHELMHFLMLLRAQEPGDRSAGRQHLVIDALLADDPDKAAVMQQLLQGEWPGAGGRPDLEDKRAGAMRLLRQLRLLPAIMPGGMAPPAGR